MKHYHIFRNWDISKIVMSYRPMGSIPFPMPNGFEPYMIPLISECNNSLSWTDSNGHWQGDGYNTDAMCIYAVHRDIDKEGALNESTTKGYI